MKPTVALLFPGQGSQYAGMGKFLLQENPELLAQVDSCLKYPLSKLMLEGPEEELKLTQNAQPAILAHSYALYLKLQSILLEKKIGVVSVLGHSVGEYSALTAASVFKFQDAILSVHMRGRFMQEAVPAGVGKMYALMRVPENIVKEACQKCSDQNYQVMPANYNEPGQTVISGHKEACSKVLLYLEQDPSLKFRAIELNVSAPFHSTLMKEAGEKLSHFLDTIPMQNNQITYMANINATEYPPYTPITMIKKNLVDQVAGSVLWSQSIKKLPNHIKCFEVGPGKVLTGLVKKINPEIQVFPLDTEDAFKKIEEFLT